MNVKELRKLNRKDLTERLSKKKEDFGAMKFDVKIGKESDTAELRFLKKEIARILTILKDGNFSKEESKPEEKTAGKKTKADK